MTGFMDAELPPIERAAEMLNTGLYIDMHARRREAILAGRSLLNVEQMAAVLNLHASFKASPEIQDPNTPWYWECDGCDARLALSGTYGRAEVLAALAKHQAEAIRTAQLGEHA